MTITRRAFALSVLLLVCGVAASSRQETAAPAKASLSAEQMEQFLLKARLVSIRSAGDGITDSRRATFTDGSLTHDVHVQTIDEYRAVLQTTQGTEINFKDSYRYNVGGYRLARLLGMDNVPMSVERRIQGTPSAVTWWIDDVMMDERERLKKNVTGPDASRYAMQVHIQRVFDELIQNRDRNLGNIVWTSDWRMWLIDHTRAFRLGKNLLKPELLGRCDRALFAAIRGLTRESVAQAVGGSLTRPEIDAVVTRADVIVKHFEKRIAERTEANVLFTLTPR